MRIRAAFRYFGPYTAVTPALQAAAAANDYVPWHAYGYPASATVIGASTPGGACTVLGSKVSGSDGFAAYGYCVMGAGQQNITLRDLQRPRAIYRHRR